MWDLKKIKFNIDKRKGEIIAVALIFFSLVIAGAVAMGPWRVFEGTRNATRYNHMEMIMNAVYSHVSLQGEYPDCIPSSQEDPVSVFECEDILTNYITYIPEDPHSQYEYMIEFTDRRDEVRVFSTAPEAEGMEVTH